MKTTIDTIEFTGARRFSEKSVEANYKVNPTEDEFWVIWQMQDDDAYKLTGAHSGDEQLEERINAAINESLRLAANKQYEELDALDDSWFYSAIVGSFNADNAKNFEPDLVVREGSVVIKPNGQEVCLISDDDMYIVNTRLHIALSAYTANTLINGNPFENGSYPKKIVDAAIQSIVKDIYAKVRNNMQKAHNADFFASIDKADNPDALLIELCLAKGDTDVVDYRPARPTDILRALNLPIEEENEDSTPVDLNVDRARHDYEIASDLLEIKEYFAVIDTANRLTLLAKEAPLEGQRYYSTTQETLKEVEDFFDMCRIADQIKISNSKTLPR